MTPLLPVVALASFLTLSPTFASAQGATLPSLPDTYIDQAARVRRSHDRPWLPDAGQLGNLRHLQIRAADCVVRVVSGTENRVFPGTRGVAVVEESRVLDRDPDERPTPRDVVLVPDSEPACQGPGSCGVSVTRVTRASAVSESGPVCFTVQIATAHDLLVGGDGLTLLFDRVRQPALRLFINPSARLRVGFEQVNLGLLAINANAPVRVVGTGTVDFLQGSSSSRGSAMYLHEFDAKHVGISTTTTGTQWSIRIGPGTKAGYYQPARAPGRLAENYGIEIDGPLERLEIPASRVDPHPLSDATRHAARTLREAIVTSAGRAPALPAPDPSLPTATAAAAALPRDARQRVADVLARLLPATVRITHIALWKNGGRLEGLAPDAETAATIEPLLRKSGEFTHVSGGKGIARDGGVAFSMQLHFSCTNPGEPSVCPAGDPSRPGTYTEAQLRGVLRSLIGPIYPLREVRLDGATITLKVDMPNETEARAALQRLADGTTMFRTSTSSFGPGNRPSVLSATLKLTCTVPPTGDGICALPGR